MEIHFLCTSLYSLVYHPRKLNASTQRTRFRFPLKLNMIVRVVVNFSFVLKLDGIPFDSETTNIITIFI